MKTSLLIELLLSLSNKEVRELRLFLASPFFNKRAAVSRLFDYLIECLHELDTIPTREQSFRSIHPAGTTYDDQQMRLLMSWLHQAVKQYLLYQRCVADEAENRIMLSAIFRERNLERHYQRNQRHLHQLQQKASYRNAAFYDHQARMELEEYRLATTNRRTDALNLQEIDRYTDTTYLARKLRQACLALSHQAVYKTEYDFGLLPKLLSYIDNRQLTDIPVIAVYYHGYRCLADTSDKNHFVLFRDAIYRHGTYFPPDELGDLYLLAINVCIKQYNRGEESYLQDEFELYRRGLEAKVFQKDGHLSRFTYRNVVTLGLVLGRLDWTESFIHQYRNELARPYQESMFSYNLARLAYRKRDYDKALQLLQRSDYKDLLLNLAAKTLLLKIFFELDETDLLYAHIEAMRTYLRRKKVMGYHRENYTNLLRFTRKLIDTNPYERDQFKALHAELTATPVVAEKGWLLQQMDAMFSA